ncbi:MAG TPA: M20/M25/M40 family metallo-hydrolase [Pyrinomonadaceae bacterium]|nr:M20/M25/M40 family metallo-hydrolase [Pyrinomonadaceae bacterium]
MRQLHQSAARLTTLLLALLLSSAPLRAQTALSEHQRLLFDIYKELVETNTTDSVGNTTEAAEKVAARLRAAGFPAEDVQVVVHPGNAKKGNVVARLRGTGARKPILLLAHLDVVEAKKEDWSPDLDPFKLIEREGFYYGRGSVDDKAMAAIFVANLIRYRQEGFKPERDIVVALTADEEGGGFNGASWLVRNRRELVDAEFGFNEGGGGRERNGKALFNGVQASEKFSRNFTLEVKNKGGHSSLPVKDNAIYTLAEGLARLSRFDFPVNLNEVTRAYFQRMSSVETGQTAADMRALVASNGADAASAARLSETAFYNSVMRTTCVATRVEAGHANNALPQTARANVNCRILPQDSPADVEAALVRVLADPKISVKIVASNRAQGEGQPPLTAGARPPAERQSSPLNPQILGEIERVTAEMWPGVPVVPMMGTGATDSQPFRQAGISMYGVSGLFTDIDDVRTHGKDERIAARRLYEGQEFLYRLVKSLSK